MINTFPPLKSEYVLHSLYAYKSIRFAPTLNVSSLLENILIFFYLLQHKLGKFINVVQLKQLFGNICSTNKPIFFQLENHYFLLYLSASSLSSVLSTFICIFSPSYRL